MLQHLLNSRANFKPGRRTSLDLGYRIEVTDKLEVMLQVNALHRARDAGGDAEPEDSGGRFLSSLARG